MPRYVALFRGINVGKAKRIAMADLRALLEELGYSSVATLLNSGNAVFTGAQQSASRHAAAIRAAVSKQLGVDALVIVKSARELAGMLAENTVVKIAKDHSRLLVAITQDARSLAGIERFSARSFGDERLQVGKFAAYMWCAHGILESKLAVALLKDLDDTGTTRNWATLNKIHALMAADGR